MLRVPLLLGVIAAITAAAPAAAQTAHWDAPSFLSPGHNDDIGAYYLAPDHAEWGLVGVYRKSGSLSLAARAGWVEVTSEDGAVIVGVDFGKGISLGGSLLSEISIGFGASIADQNLFRIPAGLVVGIAFGESDFTVRPYTYPHAALDILSAGGITDTELDLGIDVGVDFDIGTDFVVRAGATFGQDDFTSLGIGFAVKTPRGAEVH
jgi:hypothetical protein